MTDPLASGPTVNGVNPNTGTTLGGDSVTITGSKLSGAVSVNFGRVATVEFTVDSSTQITATTPAQDADTVDVAVITAGGSSPPSAQFTYRAPPEITAIDPATGPPGTEVTITGSGFTGVDSVTFGDVAASFVIDSDSSITTIAPEHPNGDVVITVSTPDGNTTGDFSYTGAVSPDLTGVTIQRGESLSSALDCTLKFPLLIFMPEGWDAAVLSFCISIGDLAYFDLRDGEGEMVVNLFPHTAAVIDPEWFVTGCYVKFRSGFGREPVAQTDDRTFMVVMADR